MTLKDTSLFTLAFALIFALIWHSDKVPKDVSGSLTYSVTIGGKPIEVQFYVKCPVCGNNSVDVSWIPPVQSRVDYNELGDPLKGGFIPL